MSDDFYTNSFVYEVKQKDIPFLSLLSSKQNLGIGAFSQENNWFQDKYTMCIVYSPWCQHCHKSITMFQTFAENLYHQIHFCAINSEDIYHKNDSLTAELDVHHYPSLWWFTPVPKVKKLPKMTEQQMKEWDSYRNRFVFYSWNQPLQEKDLQLWLYSHLSS